MKIGSQVTVRRLTREMFGGDPLEGYFRPYTRASDETSALEAELNHQELSGFMFTQMGPTEADTFHFEHPLLADYCLKHGLEISGPVRLSLDGDVLVLQPVNYNDQPQGDAYRIPFVPKMGFTHTPAVPLYFAVTPSDDPPEG